MMDNEWYVFIINKYRVSHLFSVFLSLWIRLYLDTPRNQKWFNFYSTNSKQNFHELGSRYIIG